MNIPLLQSKNWQKLQEDLGKTTFFKKTTHFSYLATLETTKIGNYLYLPYGPCSDSPKAFSEAIRDLKTLAQQQSAVFIRVEPQTPKNARRLRENTIFHGLLVKKSQDLNPKETWVIDLKGKEADLKKRLPSRLLRYHRNHQKTGLEIEISKNPSDTKHLVRLQQKLASSKKIGVFSEDYLKTEAKQDFSSLYLVKYTPSNQKTAKVIAAGLVFDDKTTRYNIQGAQDEDFKKLHATGILTIQLILDAREKGLKTFDFWGIAPENAKKSHSWAGFTAFKKTFSGHEVTYCGTYDLILDRKKYHLYSLLRKLNRLLRKLSRK